MVKLELGIHPFLHPLTAKEGYRLQLTLVSTMFSC